MEAAPEGPAPEGSVAGLPASERVRGRRLVYASHPLGMTHQRTFSAELPTLALLGLGAGDALVGLQRSLEPLLQLLRLPTLRATARWPMRRILVGGQIAAVIAGAPLLAYGALVAMPSPAGVAIAMASLAGVCAALAIAQTVWFPLLYHYPEPGRTGRFFGIVRSGWHAALIVYFLLAQRWLTAHPGAFGALFAVGWACGVLRIVLLARLPEPAAPPADAPIAAGGATALSGPDWRAPLRDPRFRAYLAAMSLGGAARRMAAPFAVVLMRRELGLSDADLVWTTVAIYSGGLVSLYAFGLAADRFGTGPVFAGTALVGAGATLALVGLPAAGPSLLVLATALFFVQSVSTAGFEVADTNLLFRIAPAEGPAATLVTASVAISAIQGLAPFAAGLALEAALGAAVSPETAYGALFLLCAAMQLAALLPLRAAHREAVPGRPAP